jgi:hypothetical protein
MYVMYEKYEKYEKCTGGEAHKGKLLVQWNALPRTWIGSILGLFEAGEAGCCYTNRRIIIFAINMAKAHIRLNADPTKNLYPVIS